MLSICFILLLAVIILFSNKSSKIYKSAKILWIEEWNRHGKEVLENILQSLRDLGNIFNVSRHIQWMTKYCLNLVGWRGCFSNTSRPCPCISIVIWRKHASPFRLTLPLRKCFETYPILGGLVGKKGVNWPLLLPKKSHQLPKIDFTSFNFS